jgi:8-oxo-dGTP pyrophosphatase MutT (NUDIX family)
VSEAAARAVHPRPTGPPRWFTGLVEGLPSFTDSRLGRLTPPPEARPRQSAVLALFSAGEDPGALGNGPDVLLTQRHAGLRSHAGQVAFPGGRLDAGDDGPRGAALREAHEETGLDPAGVLVAGLAPRLWIPVTNYHVTPVVAWWERPSPVSATSRREVERVVRVPLVELADPVNRFMVVHPRGIAGPGFEVQGLFVWGFTAFVLTALLALGGWERRWDTSRLVPLPPQPTPEEAEAEQAVPDADADPDGVVREERGGHA